MFAVKAKKYIVPSSKLYLSKKVSKTQDNDENIAIENIEEKHDLEVILKSKQIFESFSKDMRS